MALRGVLFDLDDTLLDSTGVDEHIWVEIVEVIASRVPTVDRERLRERYVGVTESHYVELAASRINLATFRRNRLADALSPWGEVDDDLFELYLREKNRTSEEIAAFPDAVSVLRGLRTRGIRVGVLTNGPSEFQRRKLEVSGLEAELDAIAISAEIGLAKPAAAAFAAALERLGTTAKETAMVGDSLPSDVEGAIGAGLAAVVWLHPDGDPPSGALTATSLGQVPALLGLG